MGTWANVTATGVGGDGVEFRLVIEGLPYEPCTDGMVTGACSESGQSGKRRIGGLLRESVGFTETAYLAGAKLDIGITPLRIVETAGPADLDALTSIFTKVPTAKAWLSATLGSDAFTDTGATVHSSADLEVDEHYHLGTEVVRVAAIAGTSVTLERELWRTTAQRHTVEETDGTPKIRALRDAPSTWINRRVWLYAHGADELDLADTGTLIFRGVLQSDPQLEGGDATTWILNVASRWTILEQEIGAGNDKPRQVSGIYYPGSYALTIFVRRSTDATRGGALADEGTVRIVGRYATQEAFGKALADALNATTAATNAGWTFSVVEYDGQWELRVTMGAVPYYPEIQGGSPVDGWFTNRVRTTISSVDDLPGTVVDTVSASTSYFVEWGAAPAIGAFAAWNPPPVPVIEMRRVPRTIGCPSNGWAHSTASDVTTHPSTRVYLTSIDGISAGSTMLIAQPGGEGEPHRVEVSTVDDATGAVTGVDGRPVLLLVSGQHTQEITTSLRVGAEGINLADFRDALIAAAPDGANSGGVPFVLGDDLADWSTVVDAIAATNPRLYDERDYTFQQGVRLTEVLEHEAMICGLFYYLDADFKIGVRPLTLDTQDVADSHVLSDEDGSIITEGGFGELASGEDGQVNVVEFHRGYDPQEDKHVGGKVRVRSVEGVTDARKERVLEVKPKSRAFGDRDALDEERAYELAEPVLALFGGKILHYTVSVSLKHFGVLVGDTVLVSSQTLPYNGARACNSESGGMRSVRALVVARDWSEIASGTGRLTLLVPGADVVGYSPSGRVASASGATTSWTLTLEANRYSPSGSVDASYFVAGDVVELVEWDAASPTTRVGTVDSVSGNDVAVTLESSWTGLGGATYILTFVNPTTADLAERQYEYAQIADSTLRRSTYSGSAGARIFAP